jgi:hypothetical protein
MFLLNIENIVKNSQNFDGFKEVNFMVLTSSKARGLLHFIWHLLKAKGKGLMTIKNNSTSFMWDYKYLKFNELLLVFRGNPILEVERDLEPFKDPKKDWGRESGDLKISIDITYNSSLRDWFGWKTLVFDFYDALLV